MLQINSKVEVTEEQARSGLEDFYNAFPVVKTLTTNEDFSEWDMSMSYTPNWACIWNDPKDRGKELKIICKDSLMAIVLFVGNTKNLTSKHFYRLEDLSPFKK